jgi:hypothetical protein
MPKDEKEETPEGLNSEDEAEEIHFKSAGHIEGMHMNAIVDKFKKMAP